MPASTPRPSDLEMQVGGKTIVMAGAGGAAAGAAEALTRAGARLRIVARRVDAARALRVRLIAPQQERVTVTGWTADALAEALTGADALVSAVPAAAWTTEALSGLAALAPEAVVLEDTTEWRRRSPPPSAVARARTPTASPCSSTKQRQCQRRLRWRTSLLPPLFEAVRRG